MGIVLSVFRASTVLMQHARLPSVVVGVQVPIPAPKLRSLPISASRPGFHPDKAGAAPAGITNMGDEPDGTAGDFESSIEQVRFLYPLRRCSLVGRKRLSHKQEIGGS